MIERWIQIAYESFKLKKSLQNKFISTKTPPRGVSTEIEAKKTTMAGFSSKVSSQALVLVQEWENQALVLVKEWEN